MSDASPAGQGARRDSEGPAASTRPGRPRVLLVDDHAPNLLALEALLGALDAETERATSGERALALLGGGEYAVVLLDVRMPGLDGFATLERLRERDRVTPVLFISADAAEGPRVRRAYELGAVDFLAKPVDADALRAKVGVFLELARARDEARARARADAERGRLQALIEQAPVAMAAFSGPAHAFELVNAQFVELVGGRPLLGRSLREAFPEVEGQGLFETFDRAYLSGERLELPEFEARFDRKGGGGPEARVVALTLAPRAGGGGAVGGLVLVAVDVTERARARERLALSEARYRSFVEATSQMIWSATAEGDIVDDSPSWRAFTGQSYEEWRGRGWLDALHPDDVEAATEAWAGAVRSGTSYEVEYRVRRRDGEYRVTRARGAPVRDEAGVVREWVGVNVDVTAQKRAEAERDELFAREQKARAEAEGANRMKDEFLATVSHELRTPLNAMLGWATMLQGGSLDAATRARAVETIERNARAQARLIEDLLDLSRILQGKFVLAVGPVELVRVVEGALDAVRPAAEAKGVRLQPVLDSHATIVGDAERLQQIAWNLLSNAIKFTPKGGRVQVTLRRAPSYVELAVADTGQGIEPAFLPHVFEPFRQADGGITRRSGGLGLGLSIVRSLVELHGGTVVARSDGPGQGATFVVRLPMAPLRADRAEPAVEPAPDGPERGTFECPPALAGLRLLVVDDEPDTRSLLAFVLGQCDARVTTVGSAAEAYAALAQAPFDVLISDIGMTGEDGLSLLRRVRQLPPERGGRVLAVALTAYARGEDRARALRAGFSTHLAKPIEPAELVLVIAALVANLRA